MPNQHDEHHDAHVVSLRLALGTILSPKRSSSSRSSTATSGTASPMHGHPHAHGHSHLHTSHSPEMAHAFLPAEQHPTSAASTSSRAARIPLPRSQTESTITSKSATSGSDNIPRAVPPLARPSSVPISSIPLPTANDDDHPARADFMGTLRSKSAWDALIHGSFV